jgi:hypothetical protein
MRIYGDEALMMSLTDEEKSRLAKGRAISRGNKIYAVCQDCKCVVRINKPLVGSMHSCEP